MDNNNEELVCPICFTEFEENDNKFNCSNPKCNELICGDCLESLIQYSHESNLLPTCPSNDCNGLYILSNLKGMDKQAIVMYEESCLNYFTKENGDTIKKRIEEKNIVEKIRNERLQFLEKEFPKGITFVAKLAFKDKLRQLDKQKKSLIGLKLKNANKSCLNKTCNGFLDPDFVCMTCSTEFCNKCEKKLTKEHQCKQEDLDSLNLVNNMVKCPGCKLPVFKNEGCDSITCSNCNTQFLYSTGKEGGHGSFNAKIKIDINKKVKLSSEYGDKISKDNLELLLKFEALEPHFLSKDMLLGPVRLYISNSNKTNKTNKMKQKWARDLAKKIDRYTRWKYRNVEYHKYSVEINDIIIENDDNKLKIRLEEIIKLLE